jgi:hypothetical protein
VPRVLGQCSKARRNLVLLVRSEGRIVSNVIGNRAEQLRLSLKLSP